MPSLLTIGISQSHTLHTKDATLAALKTQTEIAAQKNISVLLFPEAYLGGYPRTCSFGASIGNRDPIGREQFLAYHKEAVDLGDTFEGAEERWTKKELPLDEVKGYRGDGTREYVEEVSRRTGVFLVIGIVERAGGSLFCSAMFVHPEKGVVAKRRKLQPTGTERLVWAQGSASTLKAVATTIKGVRVVMASAICWENYMPLLRYSLYAQGVNLWLAPTADGRPTWEGLMTTIACEGRCFVLSANQCQKFSDIPEWATKTAHGQDVGDSHLTNGETKDTSGQKLEYASSGGSCIVNPFGKVVVGPVRDKQDELLYADVDFDDCARGKLDFDATGHYSSLVIENICIDQGKIVILNHARPHLCGLIDFEVAVLNEKLRKSVMIHFGNELQHPAQDQPMRRKKIERGKRRRTHSTAEWTGRIIRQSIK